MPKMRTYYDREFKLKAVELSHEREDSVAELAKELGLSVKLLYRWRSQYSRQLRNSFPGQGKQLLNDEEKKIAELEKQNRELRLERDILKKAVGIFSRNDGKSINL